MKKIKNEQRNLICRVHGITTFSKSGIKVIRWKCCKCDYDYSRKYFLNLKLKGIDFKGAKCMVCGYDESKWSLDFHHRDPKQKEFHIFETHPGMHLKRKRNWEEVRTELDKCDLLCKNCHHALHEREHLAKQKSKNLNLSIHRKEIHRINYLILTGRSSVEEQMKIILDKHNQT